MGIRSKTRLTADILSQASKLRAIGCFCIVCIHILIDPQGTNQVDLAEATARGIPVFNSPFSNSRSVAELVLAETIALLRNSLSYNSSLRHEHQSPSGLGNEVRGKTLGIVGYGHIGTQLSVLADALGIHVAFFDSQSLMPLGSGI